MGTILKWFSRFMGSKLSGGLFIVALMALGVVTSFGWKLRLDYEQLKTDAAFCKGQQSVSKVLKNFQDIASEAVEKESDEVIDEIEDLKDEVEGIQGPTGCANQLAPDSILRFHGWLPNDGS